MSHQYIVQRLNVRSYTELFDIALSRGEYTHFDAAVAYATLSGVRVVDRLFGGRLGEGWNQLHKRWLVGIDWCRSDPPALDRLSGLSRSEVKSPNGSSLIARPGCVPRVTYHPKLFMLHGNQEGAIICGSGNLSANGLTRGCECGSVLLVTGTPAILHPQMAELQAWFQSAWDGADSYAQIRDSYEQRCQTVVREERPVPTEDDIDLSEVDPQRSGRGLSDLQIRQLRTYQHLWIEAGSLGSNLGRGVPGNQLDMRRFSRVFFGAAASDVPPNTIIDRVTLVWGDERHSDRTLKFGDNGMDKLNIPPVGDRGPLYYRDKTLLFTRQSNGEFLFGVGNAADLAHWRRASRRVSAHHLFPGGRKWGLF